MDSIAFDTLARAVAQTGTRRRLLRRLATQPLAALLLARLDTAGQAASRRHQRRRRQRRSDRHQHLHDAKKKKKKCAQAGQPTSKQRKQCCPGLVKAG